MEETLVRGWMIAHWVDNRILRRLEALEGASGIVAKWREVLKGIKGNGLWRDFIGLTFVNVIGLRWNILYLFFGGIAALGVALLVWIAEWVFYAVYTRPRRKWQKEMELVRKRIFSEQMQVTSESGRGSVSSCESLEDQMLDQPEEHTDEKN